jgi:hypothetical protein
MRCLTLLIAAALPLVAFTTDEADAQRRIVHPGIHGSGFRSTAVRPRGQFRQVRVRHGRWQGRQGWWGPGRAHPRRWARPVYYPRRWGRPVYYRRYRPWGWGRPVYYRPYNPWAWGWGLTGLATGVAIGAAIQPTPIFATPIRSSIGGYCVTPVRTCALINPAPIGTGCSCRTPGGRARGGVVGP